MRSNERDTSRRRYPAVLTALQVTLLVAVLPTSAVGEIRLTDETRLDGTRTLEWGSDMFSLTGANLFTASPVLSVRASCLFDETQEGDRLRLRFGWKDIPSIDDGEVILFKADDAPVQELPARMAEDGSIDILWAGEAISQMIGAEEVVFGVRGEGGVIDQRDLNRTGREGMYTLEAFRARCLNPDLPRATRNYARASLPGGGLSGQLEILTADNGDLVLKNSVLDLHAVSFRCLTEPQTWGGRSWSAGTMIMSNASALVLRRSTVPVGFDDEEPQEIAMAEGAIYSGTYWTITDARPILENAVVSDRMDFRRGIGQRVFVGDLTVEIFLDRARRLGCGNTVVEQPPEVPATSENEDENQPPTLLTEDILPFIYESRAEVPALDESLFRLISPDYESAGDEFARRAHAERLKPILDRRLADARAVSRVTVEFGSGFGAYDFERSGFPTNHTTESYIPLRAGAYRYAIRFSNAADLSFVPVAEDVAQELVSSMSGRREIVITVTGTIVSAEPSVSVGKAVYVRAEQVDVALRSGTTVGTLEL